MTGQAAAPPSSLMNSRRLMGTHPEAKDRRISIAGRGCAPQQEAATYVRFGSKADIRSELASWAKSALPPKADISSAGPSTRCIMVLLTTSNEEDDYANS